MASRSRARGLPNPSPNRAFSRICGGFSDRGSRPRRRAALSTPPSVGQSPKRYLTRRGTLSASGPQSQARRAPMPSEKGAGSKFMPTLGKGFPLPFPMFSAVCAASRSVAALLGVEFRRGRHRIASPPLDAPPPLSRPNRGVLEDVGSRGGDAMEMRPATRRFSIQRRSTHSIRFSVFRNILSCIVHWRKTVHRASQR